MSNLPPSDDYDPPPREHSRSTCPMPVSPAAQDDELAVLVGILDRYIAAIQAGESPDAAALLREHPQFASQLTACLEGIDFIHRSQPGGAVPRSLGDFEILREVGRGGMGAVYEARQVSLDRRVALKILRCGTVSDPQVLERFRREAETVAQLHHTHIVPVYAVGTEGGVNYYVMQFIDGESLAEVLRERQGPLGTETIATWGLQAAEALEYAHQHGVIHRDVKPSNLLLDREGRIKLTTDGPPLAAELFAANGSAAAAPTTLPMQVPLTLAAGEYAVRLSGENRLSQAFAAEVHRGANPVYGVDLDDQLLWPELSVDRSFTFVDRGERTDLVHLRDDGLALVDGLVGQGHWSLDLARPTDPKLPVDQPLLWPWTARYQFDPFGGRGKFDLRPEVCRQGPDLNGDGIGEVVLAARHEAWVLVLCGRRGEVLWLADRRADDEPAAEPTHDRLLTPRSIRSSILGAPAVLDDVDGDGVPDLAFAVLLVEDTGLGGSEPWHAQRWMEAVSGASGEALWRFDLDDLLFFHAPNDGLDAGGTLHAVDGAAVEAWRRLGLQWKPGHDYDGDGVADLVATAEGAVAVRSTRTGETLWRTPQRFRVAGTISLDDDLNGDGTPDILVWVGADMRSRPFRPLTALCGRTGRELWTGAFEVSQLIRSLAATSADLTGDGEPEIVYLAVTNGGYPDDGVMTFNSGQLSVTVLSGRDGTLLWQQPLSAAYRKAGTDLAQQNFPFHLRDVAPQIVVADFGAQGRALVLVGEAKVPADEGLALIALRGTDGEVLWQQPIATDAHQWSAYTNAAFATAIDLDGDGIAEVVYLDFLDPQDRTGVVTLGLSGQEAGSVVHVIDPSTGGPAGRVARLVALDGLSGAVRWTVETAVDPDCGRVSHDPRRAARRPRAVPLRRVQGEPWIAVNLWGMPGEVLVVDHAGGVVNRFEARSDDAAFRILAVDAEGDGNDEIVMVREAKLQALRPEEPEAPLWTAGSRGLWSPELLWAEGNDRPLVAFRTDGTITGIDLASGKALWRCAGPRPRSGGAWLEVETHLVENGSMASAPYLLFTHSSVTVCRRGVPTDAAARLALRGPARLDGARDAVRLPLPWVPLPPDAAALAEIIPWAFFFSFTMVILPLGTMAWLAYRRTWGMETMLGLPLVVALAVPGLTAEGPEELHTLFERFFAAVLVVPAAVLLAAVVWQAARGRGRWLGIWTAVFLGTSAALAIAVLSWNGFPGKSGVYAWNGWYWIGLPAFEATGMLLLIHLAAAAAVRGFRRIRSGPGLLVETADAT